MSAILFQVLVDASLRVSVLAILVAAILAAFRVRASAVLHASWTAVLCAMLLMPLLPYCVPAFPIPLSPPRSLASTDIGMEAVARDSLAVLTDPVVQRSRPSSATGTRSAESFSSRPTEGSRAGSPFWLLAALVVYSVGASVLALRCWLGWRAAGRIARTGQRVVLPRAPARLSIRESRAVVTPMTVGAITPTVLLPVTWRLWSDEKLSAILAHELAHIERHDTFVSLVAHINRCLFWFHPLAWWLEHTLAATAEHASDEVAIRTIGERARYAEILLDMAEPCARAAAGSLRMASA